MHSQEIITAVKVIDEAEANNRREQAYHVLPPPPAPRADPLRKLNQIGRSFFRSLLPAVSINAESHQPEKRAKSNERPWMSSSWNSNSNCNSSNNNNNNNNKAEDDKSRLQVELGGDDDDETQSSIRTDCCLPLSHLIIQQQPEVVCENKKPPRDHLVDRIKDNKSNGEYGPEVSAATGRTLVKADNWLNDLQSISSSSEPKSKEHQPPVQQQPISQQQKQQQQQQLKSPPHPQQMIANDLLLQPSQNTHRLASSQRSSVTRALSKSSKSGSRWSGNGSEQKLDRMEKLIALLDKLYLRRTSLQQQQQLSSVIGSQINSGSTCDLLDAQTNGTTDNENDLFFLEESWQHFVKLPSSLSSTTLANEPSSSKTNEEEMNDDNQTIYQHQLWANLKIQQDAIWELLTTEVFYIKRLKVIIDLFLTTLIELQQHSVLVEIDAKQVFCNIVEIYEANCSFWTNHLYPMLAKARSTRQPIDPVEMKNAFVHIGSIFNPYYRYCLDHKACLSYFKEQNRSNECFKVYVAWCESQKDCERLRLMDLLAKPMQRLTRYSLLLRAISKKTDNQAVSKALEHMIANMNRFVLTVDLELRRQEELELLMSTMRRIESIDIGAGDVYNDEIGRLVKGHYCHFDITMPLFNCPFKCHRQLLFDSQSFTRGHQLGQLRFKDSQSSGKLDIVLLIFTDHLFICRPLSSSSSSTSGKWSHQHQQSTARTSGGGGATSPSRGQAAGLIHCSLLGGGSGLLGCQLLAGTALSNTGAAAETDKPHQTSQPSRTNLAGPRPRAGSHQQQSSSGLAQASLSAHNNNYSQQKQQQSPQSPSRALSLILPPDASISVAASNNNNTFGGGQVGLLEGRRQQMDAVDTQQDCGLSQGKRACSQTCISLSSASSLQKFSTLSLSHRQQNLFTTQSQLTASFGAACPNYCLGGSGVSGPSSPVQRTSFHASSSSLVGNAAREFFRRSAESSRSGDISANYQAAAAAAAAATELAYLSSANSGQATKIIQRHHIATTPSQATGDPPPLRLLRVIRSPYPVERLVMHELKGGQGVFFCQLNDSQTIANSFVLYCPSTSASGLSFASQTSAAAAAAAHYSKANNNNNNMESPAVKRSSSDQQASTISGQQQQQQLRLANSNQESQRSDSEVHQLPNYPRGSSRRESELAASHGNTPSMTMVHHQQQNCSPARQLINLVKQAQGRYQVAAKYHKVSVAKFGNPELNDTEPQLPVQVELSQQTKSRLSTWSSFRQTPRRYEQVSKNSSPMSNNQAYAGLFTSSGGKINSKERAKLERRSASSEYNQQQELNEQQHHHTRQQTINYSRLPMSTRLSNPFGKALFEQQQSMLLNHGELEAQIIEQANESSHPSKSFDLDAIHPPDAVPEHHHHHHHQQQHQACSYGHVSGNSSGPSVCGSDFGGPNPPSNNGASRAGSQSSVFDELTSSAGFTQQQQRTANCIHLQAPQATMERQHRSFSSPTSPKREPNSFNLPLEGQQLLSPNRYRRVRPNSMSCQNWSESSSKTIEPSSPTSNNRRHGFSHRSTRISGNGNQLQQYNAVSDTEAAPTTTTTFGSMGAHPRSPLSANESNKSINSPGTSFTSSDSEFGCSSTTRSSSPFVGQIGRQKHTESSSSMANLWQTNHHHSASPRFYQTNNNDNNNRMYQPIVVPSASECSAAGELSPISGGQPSTSSAGKQRQSRRCNLSSLRRQNVILSASSDQQQIGQDSLLISGNNNRRPSDIAMQRQQQLAATSNWLSGGAGGSSRDSSSMATDAGPQTPPTTSHLAPTRHRQFLASHHYQQHPYLTSSSQATTVDQTNSAVFDSAEQLLDPPQHPVSHQQQEQQQQHQNHQLSASNSASGCSNSFELGHLGSQRFHHQAQDSYHHHHHNHHHSSNQHQHQHRNSCFSCTASDHTRSASMETRSPISVTLTLPNNEALSPEQESHLAPSRVTSPVYLSIPRLEAAAARRALLSPIDSVAATSPVADERDWSALNKHQREQQISDDLWNEENSGYVSGGGEQRVVPDVNITTNTSTAASSPAGDYSFAGCDHLDRRKSSGELDLSTEENSSGNADGRVGASTDWPKAMIRRKSSSNEELFPAGQLAHSSGASSGYLGFYEKLRLHNRLEEEQQSAHKTLLANASRSYRRSRWPGSGDTSNRKTRLLKKTLLLSRHSTSSTQNCSPSGESRSSRALNKTRSMTGELFDSFMKATSLRSVSSGGGGIRQ